MDQTSLDLWRACVFCRTLTTRQRELLTEFQKEEDEKGLFSTFQRRAKDAYERLKSYVGSDKKGSDKKGQQVGVRVDAADSQL
jgi:hypothetical protein